jgi:hypothetical protein
MIPINPAPWLGALLVIRVAFTKEDQGKPQDDPKSNTGLIGEIVIVGLVLVLGKKGRVVVDLVPRKTSQTHKPSPITAFNAHP